MPKDCCDVNHNTIPPSILIGDEVSKPQRGVDVLPQSGWPVTWGVLDFRPFLPGHAEHFYFLCFPDWTIWLPLLNGIVQDLLDYGAQISMSLILN